MSTHFKVVCRVCLTVIAQCRCISPDKTTTYAVCDACKAVVK